MTTQPSPTTRDDAAQALEAIGTFVSHLKANPEHQTPEILDALEHAIDIQTRWLQENGAALNIAQAEPGNE